jgi:hypothetical protein
MGRKLDGRTDVNEYLRGAKEITNGIVMPQGGVTRRPGTQFVLSQVNAKLMDGTVPTAGNPITLDSDVRLIPFIYSVDESYLLIIGYDSVNSESWISIYDTKNDTEISAGNITRNANDYIPNIVSYASAAELKDIQYAQSGDVLWLTHPNHPPWVLRRETSTTFTINDLGNFKEAGDEYRAYPFQDLNTTSTTIGTSGAGATRSFTASAPVFTADMVGSDKTALFKLTDTAGTGDTYVYRVTSFGSSTSVTAVIEAGSTSHANFTTSEWAESAWNGERGYPRAVTLFEQRTYYGGTEFQPDTVWGSQTGDFYEMDAVGLADSKTLTATDAYNFTVASTEVNQVQWLSAGSVLTIGTLGREYLAQGTSGSLSATDISVTPETAQGSAFVQPIRVENSLVFTERSGQRLREFIFNRDENAFNANDLTYLKDDAAQENLYGPNIVGGEARGNAQITEMHYQANDFSVMWLKNNYGGLFGLTRNRQRKVAAMHFHTFGGSLSKASFSGVVFNPEVTSLAVVSNSDGTHDDVWLAIKRTIDGSDVVYIEKMGKELQRTDIDNTDNDIAQKMVYSDSAKLVQLGGPGTSFSGFTHLAGEEVDVLGDGGYVGRFTVSAGGVITTTEEYTEIVAGLPYVTNIRSLKLDTPTRIGSPQGLFNRIDRAVIRFNKTIGAKVGSDADNLDELYAFRNQREVAMDDPTPLFTGEIKVEFRGGQGLGVEYYIRQDKALPMQITAVILRGVIYD